MLRSATGRVVYPSMASLMFRRDPVLKDLGYWDTDPQIRRLRVQEPHRELLRHHRGTDHQGTPGIRAHGRCKPDS